MRTAKRLIPGLVLFCAACASTAALADDAQHMSQVNFVPGDGATGGDMDGSPAVFGEVGKPMQFHITYMVGWYYPPPEGTVGAMSLKESDIDKPEYEALWDNDTNNVPDYPTGMSFNKAAGVFSGTPTQAGTWKYAPSVRDKEKGQDPYDGHGYWWTTTADVNGKTWIVAKDEVAVVILPAPSPKAIMLQCSGNNLDLLLQVDYDSGLVRVFGNDGKLAGVYHANISDDFIAWGKTNVYKPNFVTTSVKLDRKTGSLNTTVEYGNAPSGSCSKRSTEQKF